MAKTMKIRGGYATKRKARLVHECADCFGVIEVGEEYYELTLEHHRGPLFRGYYTKRICGDCWKGRELEA